MNKNTSPLYYKKIPGENRFLNNLDISEADEKMLLSARKIVRAAIRKAFHEARNHLSQNVEARKLDNIQKIKPKFFTQGSFAYKTLNAPCQAKQEIDLDDGVYLPMSVVNNSPSMANQFMFDVVDGALKTLAKNHDGWKFQEKSTCSRLVLSDKAHIDVPLYAIPDTKYQEVLAMNTQDGRLLNESLIKSYDSLEERRYTRLEEDQIWLAIRGHEWRASDPMAISDWFHDEISTKGKRLRRVCRYLKAWRDKTWENGGPSSIALMICASDAYPENDDKDRDDYALLEVVKALAENIKHVTNPTTRDKGSDAEVVYPRGNVDIDHVISEVNKLRDTLTSAVIGACTANVAVTLKREAFGERLPHRPDWVEDVTASASRIDQVRSTPALSVTDNAIPSNARSG